MNDQTQTKEIEILVHRGYHPSQVSLKAGQPARLTFLRREQSGCSRELVIPALGVRKELPQNTPVTIDVPPLAAGAYDFTCGMNMLRGSLVVAPT